MKKVILLLILILALFLHAEEYKFAQQYGGTCQAVKINGNYGYFNSGGNIIVLDMSNPNAVTEVNKFHLGSFFCNDIQTKDDLLIFACFPGVLIYSLSDPVHPQLISTIDQYGRKIIIVDSILIVASDMYAYIYDISNPTNPVYKSYLAFLFNSDGIYAVNDSLLYGFEQDGYSGPQSFKCYNISDPVNPVLVVQKTICNDCTGYWPKQMQVYQSYLLAAFNDSIKIYDVSKPDSINYSGSFHIRSNLSSFKITADKMYVSYNNFGVSELTISDVYNPVEGRIFNWDVKISDIDFSSDRLLISGVEDGAKLAVVNEEGNYTEQYIYQKSGIVNDIIFDPDSDVNRFAYTGSYSKGFQIWDINDSENHFKLGSVNFTRRPQKMLKQNDYFFYLCEYDSIINIINTADKTNPFVCKQLLIPDVYDYCIDNNRLFVLEYDGISVYNITDPANPAFIIKLVQTGGSIAVKNNYMFLYSISQYPFAANLKMYNITNITNVILKSQLSIGEGWGYSGNILLDYPRIFLGCRSGIVSCKVSSANQLELCQNAVSGNGNCYSYHYNSDHIYTDNYGNGLKVWEVQDQYNAFISQTIDIDADCIYRSGNVLGVAIGGGYVFYNIIDSVGIADNQDNEKSQYLLSNYPNPFNPATTIKFSLPQTGDVKLEVYNLKGELTKTLLNKSVQQGEHNITWNGDCNNGKSACSGTYFLRLSINGVSTKVKKCLLLK